MPLTPATQKVNVADAYDAQSRANNAERELSTARTKLTREIHKNRCLQQQNYEYMEALARAVQDCSVIRHYFDLVPSSLASCSLAGMSEGKSYGENFGSCYSDALYIFPCKVRQLECNGRRRTACSGQKGMMAILISGCSYFVASLSLPPFVFISSFASSRIARDSLSRSIRLYSVMMLPKSFDPFDNILTTPIAVSIR